VERLRNWTFFCRGDLKAAAAAFEKITEADPAKSRRLDQHRPCAGAGGDTAGARKVLEKSWRWTRGARDEFSFTRAALRKDGEYEGAMTHLRTVLEQFPR